MKKDELIEEYENEYAELEKENDKLNKYIKKHN